MRDVTSNALPSDQSMEAGRARRGKLFDAKQIQLLLLSLIGDEPRHGYELMRLIEERTGGTYAPSPGVVYPTLTLLQEMGLIEETGTTGARKSYSITSIGREALAESAKKVESLLARLDAIADQAANTEAAPVRRAMGNLRQVLVDRLAKAGTTDEHILEAARLIDEVAGRIERM